MKTARIVIFGLNSPVVFPDGTLNDNYGLRTLIESFVRDGDPAPLFLAYDDPQLLTKASDYFASADRREMYGHSHGGAAVKWIVDHWSIAQTAIVDLAVFLDPAPEQWHFGQFFSWQAADANLDDRWHVPLSVCRKSVCIYQRNEQIIPGIIGVCGVPFAPVPRRPDATVEGWPNGGIPIPPDAIVENINVSAWGVYHNHMLSDPRVQNLMRSAAL